MKNFTKLLRSVLILLVVFLDLFKCHESTSCNIINLTKYADSSCKFELDKTEEEKDYISKLNSMIVSGKCDDADPGQSNLLKLKVDCLSSSTVRFRFYNHLGDDETCSQDKFASNFGQNQIIIAKDGACTPISEGISYKFSIIPFATSGRQMQQVILPATAQTANLPAVGIPTALSTNPIPVYNQPYPYFPTINVAPNAPPPRSATVSNPGFRQEVLLQSPYFANLANGVRGPVLNQQRTNQVRTPVVNGARFRFDYELARFFNQRAFGTTNLNAEVEDIDESSALGTGAIVGIVIGGVCLVFLCTASLCYYKRGKKEAQDGDMEMNQAGENDDDTEDQVDHVGLPTLNAIENHGQTDLKEGDAVSITSFYH